MTISIITMPWDIAVADWVYGIERYDTVYADGDAGVSDIEVRGPPRWTCKGTSEDRLPDVESSRIQAMLLDLQGGINRLAVFDIYRPVPLGTFRGTPVVYGGALAGDKTMILDGSVTQAGKTLRQGDWIGVNQTGTNRQVVHVQDDAVADGTGKITIRFESYLRADVAAGSAAVWDHPTWLGQQQQTGGGSQWKAASGLANGGRGGYSFDLLERWLS